MEYTEERRFVQSFIRRDRRERLLYELTTPAKRHAGISRFCHRAGEFLEMSRVIMADKNLERLPEFEQFVRQHDELCYVLAPDPCLTEQMKPLREAVEMAAMSQDAAIIIGGSFAVVFTEVCKGRRDRYLLSEE